MVDKLWNDITLIYERFNFSKELLKDGLMIISNDNYYQLHYTPDKQTEARKSSQKRVIIRIEKDYNLVKMWSSDDLCDITSYKLDVEVNGKVEIDHDYKVELVYKIIKPFIREAKLNQLL